MGYINLGNFFNSERWRAVTIQRLLKEHERLTAEQKQADNKAVLQLYSYAVSLMKNNPELTVSEALELIDVRRVENGE